jgi:hypothetical protein
MHIPEKRQRLAGMITFSVFAIFLLWHLDYEDVEIVGFRNNPWGFNSFAYNLINAIAAAANNDSQSYESRNLWWFSTQVIPILTSWMLRKFLGKCVALVSTAAKYLYSKL